MKWNNIVWKHKEIWLYKLQIKIFNLSKMGDMKSVFLYRNRS